MRLGSAGRKMYGLVGQIFLAANDWAYGLQDIDDLSLVQTASSTFEALGGEPGARKASTAKVEAWVAAHAKLHPSPGLRSEADSVLGRLLVELSELRALCDESGEAREWLAGVEDLRRRVDRAK